VRYDGDHKRHDIVVTTLADRFELIAVCPELELGLGVPRPPIRLVGLGPEPQLIASDDGRDLGPSMRAFADNRVSALLELGIAGYVLKSGSPSCGLSSAERFADEATGSATDRHGRGVFVERLLMVRPDFPCIEDSELGSETALADFLAKVRAA
jgi:uncharacterized protein YbbK (DUF523 family)